MKTLAIVVATLGIIASSAVYAGGCGGYSTKTVEKPIQTPIPST